MASEVSKTITVSLIVIVFCLILLHQNPSFFWQDDSQSSFLPAFTDMAQAWHSGEFPLLIPFCCTGATSVLDG